MSRRQGRGRTGRRRLLQDEARDFHWHYYASLVHQRSQIATELRAALLSAAEGPVAFRRWQRVVDDASADQPLSGSGGRFNVGGVDRSKFPTGEALYLAKDRQTVFDERFGTTDEDAPLGALDLALRSPRSIAVHSVSGRLESVIDLRHARRLGRYVASIAALKIPSPLVSWARRIGLAIDPVRTVRDVEASLLHPAWRVSPLVYDVPAPSQLFGQLVCDAGIEGIVYESSTTDGLCLAVFPSVLGPESYVSIDRRARRH